MMVITKDKINEISSLWSAEQIDFRRQIEQSDDIQLQISQDNLKYLLLKLCDLREELDDAIACSID